MALPTAEELKAKPTSELLTIFTQIAIASMVRKPPTITELLEASSDQIEAFWDHLIAEIDLRIPARG